MKKNLALFSVLALIFAGCSKETPEVQNTTDEVVITATATAPGAVVTKVKYDDQYTLDEEIVDVDAEWENGDSFTALEVNGTTVTSVVFTTTGSGATANFTSKGAVAADDNTTWIAVSGAATVKDGKIVCQYDGQDGQLDNLGKFDYSVSKSTGKAPVFNFNDTKAQRLSYILRIVLPAGIKYMEFNLGRDEDNEGGWVVDSEGKTSHTTSHTVDTPAKMLTLPTVSAADEVCYLSVPAINYAPQKAEEGGVEARDAGLIITIMSSDKKQSQGKSIASDASGNGGRIVTYHMEKLKLIPRPLPSEAIDLGSVTYGGVTYELGAWSPYNLGGDVNTNDANIPGGLFAWAETEPRTSGFSRDSYKYNTGGTYITTIGFKNTAATAGEAPDIYFSPAGSIPYPGNTYYDIRGTKYDAARVKWGRDWCMPSNAICNNIMESGHGYLSSTIDTGGKVVVEGYTKNAYTNKQGFKSTTYGVVVVKANGAEVPFYLVPFTQSGSKNSSGTDCRYWMPQSDYGVQPQGGSIYWNRACQIRLSTTGGYINNICYMYDGLPIKAVLNK